ncbi:MAG: asparagine synthase (glutamine-hydrolyzing) [Myxococcales bacterium]|nr:asparagine synthase (glutamine-hydrolyzing) [Myxococcales bacterium]
MKKQPMCGIAGIVGKGASEHVDAVRRMMKAMEHRGPDGEGLYVAPSGRCVLGHLRLAILDPALAVQPMFSADERWAFVYNGECYNHPTLREVYKEDLHALRTTGDTEVVMRLLQAHGADILPKLNGMFAFALWDEQKETLLLARDRFGQKPLYLAKSGDLLLFASEVRALLASGLISRKVDLAGVYSYLAFGSVQEPLSILSGVEMMPPQSSMMWSSSGGATQARSYWSPPSGKQALSAVELRDAFVGAVERHLISDVPLGLFLSGGIDSSAVALAASRVSPSALNTLSIVFPEQKELSEAKYARRIAELVESRHQEIPLTGSMMLSMLKESFHAMDQPTGDAINTYMVSMAAHQAGLKVALSGLGGDELFGGYRAAPRVLLFSRLRRLFSLVRGPLRGLLGQVRPWSVSVSKLHQLLGSSPTWLSSFLVQRRVFSERQIGLLAPQLLSDKLFSGTLREGIVAKQFDQLGTLIKGKTLEDAIALLELSTYMAQTLLRDSDIMGMHHSLEIRIPFLDTAFSDAVLSLEPEARQHARGIKWRMVEAMGDWMPREIYDRPKMGFTLPFESWMRKELKPQVESGLRALAQRCEPFQEKSLMRLWGAFQERPQDVRWFRPWLLCVLGNYLEIHQLSTEGL